MEEVPVFRAAKRRKFVRSQDLSSSDSARQSTRLTPNGSSQRASDDDDGGKDENHFGIPNLIRARKHVRRPVTGVQFSTTKHGREPENELSTGPVRSDDNVDKPIDITSRFVGSTGQVVNVDKHMFVVPSMPLLTMDTFG